jgi:Ser/Thr protein kinase RdoA (MazF antagonist)
MNGGAAPRDWPAIGLAELARLARHVPALALPLQLSWHSPRPFSAAARVQGASGEVFVKRHDRRVRDARALLEEHRFLAHLRAHGAQVPTVLALVDAAGTRTTALELDGQTYEVHAVAPGVDLYADVHSWEPVRGAAHARALGGALARLHRAAQGYEAAPRRWRPLLAGFEIAGAAQLASALDRYLHARPDVARFLDGAAQAGAHAPASREIILRTLAPWHEALRPLLARLDGLWVHNDWHASNAFWTGTGEDAQVRCAIDFGLCNRGCAAADLATALERNTIAWLELDEHAADDLAAAIGRPLLALSLIEGYEAERPLAAAEREALPYLMALAHVDYALSEVDYFWGVLGNARSAALACPSFLLGHVHWFESAPGRAYLDALRAGLRARGAAPGPD